MARVCLGTVDDRFRSLVTHRPVAAAASELLGPDWEVSGIELRVPLPGFGHQGLHQDIESPTDATTWRHLRVTWDLSAFTVETGTYRFIPGSHLSGPPAETGIGMPPHPDEVRVIAAPGAIVLKSAHVWHSWTSTPVPSLGCRSTSTIRAQGLADLRLGLRSLEISNHIGGMAGDVGHLVATMDPTIGIDEIAVAHRVLGIALPRGADDFVLGPDRSIHITQQMEREVLRFGERHVLGGCVK